MKIIKLIFSILFTVVILLILIFTFWSGSFFLAFLETIALLIWIPGSYNLFLSSLKIKSNGKTKTLLLIFLFVLITGIAILKLVNRQSIYINDSSKLKIMNIYEEQLQQWYSPYITRYVATDFGDVHLIESGSEDKPVVILFPASGMAAWSWVYNIVNLNYNFHTYAIDNLGEAGKSNLYDINKFPISDEDIKLYINQILQGIQEDSAMFIGASGGGHIALRYAIQEPDKVDKLCLIGPMGFTPLIEIIPFMVWVQIFPIPPFIDYSINRAFGDSQVVHSLCNEWFRISLSGTIPQPTPPQVFTPDELATVNIPTMLILGSRDKMVGDPNKVISLAGKMPEIQIKVLDSSHLIYVEKSGEVNSLLKTFLR